MIQEPKNGPFPSSEFDLASIASTVHRLFNLSTQLTERTMWSAPFDELLVCVPACLSVGLGLPVSRYEPTCSPAAVPQLDQAREETDMPMHLPNAPEPHSPWVPAPGAGGLSELMMGDGRLAPADLESQRRQLLERDNAHGGGGPMPQHCGSADGQCRGAGAMSVKQERLIHHFAALTGQSVRTVYVSSVSPFRSAKFQDWTRQHGTRHSSASARLLQSFSLFWTLQYSPCMRCCLAWVGAVVTTGSELPDDLVGMGAGTAERWLAEHMLRWRSMGHPNV